MLSHEASRTAPHRNMVLSRMYERVTWSYEDHVNGGVDGRSCPRWGWMRGIQPSRGAMARSPKARGEAALRPRGVQRKACSADPESRAAYRRSRETAQRGPRSGAV